MSKTMHKWMTGDFKAPATQAGRALLRDWEDEASHHGIGPQVRSALQTFIQVGILRVEQECLRVRQEDMYLHAVEYAASLREPAAPSTSEE